MSRSSAIGASRRASCQLPASIQAFASSAVSRIAAPHARSSDVTRAMWARRRSLTWAHVGNPEVWSCTMSEDDVVDQFGFADPYCANGSIAMAHVVDTLKRVGIHDSHVAWGKSNHPFEHTPTNRLERARPALALGEDVPHR